MIGANVEISEEHIVASAYPKELIVKRLVASGMPVKSQDPFVPGPRVTLDHWDCFYNGVTVYQWRQYTRIEVFYLRAADALTMLAARVIKARDWLQRRVEADWGASSGSVDDT